MILKNLSYRSLYSTTLIQNFILNLVHIRQHYSNEYFIEISRLNQQINSIMSQVTHQQVPFNQVQGIASTNVHAYSNGDGDFFSVERHHLHGVFMGFKWQCVEFARRWLLMRKSSIFPTIRHAADMWTDLKYVECITNGKQFPFQLHANGSSNRPNCNTLLIYGRNDELPFGHVAVICDVLSDRVRIGEQNFIYEDWPGDYAREIPLVIKNDRYYIEDVDEILGWMEIVDNNELQPLNEARLDLILPKYQDTTPTGTLERCSITDKSFHSVNAWLDINDPAEKFFIDLFGPELIRSDTDTLPYYRADQDLLLSIGTTSNELHRMFMEATSKVINDDDLLMRFCIPRVFWPKMRRSWTNERDLSMSGRFDLAFNDKQLKVYEYNADSASALFEMSVIQEKWAAAVKLERRFMSGFQLHRLLVKNWKQVNRTMKRIHLLIDDDQDERLTSLYMQRVLKEAGIDSKLCIKTNDLIWKDSKIIDSDGCPVEFVWKLWMWETIFSDYIQAEKDQTLDRRIDGERARLCQILLNDDIQVIEPLWKVIPSNKAILPVLWSMFPNHPNLLPSEWTITDELKQTAYVKKPIVGRCGHNVTLYNINGDSVLDETSGHFLDRNCVYQALFSLPKFDGYHALIGSWIIHDLFGGFGVREDKKLITDADSPVTACGIIWK
jgi:glutathionylspermidine synthase